VTNESGKKTDVSDTPPTVVPVVTVDETALPARKNIWEISERYFCPVIGFCLSGEERNRIIKKFNRKSRTKLNEIEMHEFLVIGITRGSPIAHRVQYVLDSKYAAAIRHYRTASYREWLGKADEMLTPHDFGKYIWISASYLSWTKEQNIQIWGRIHMYTHKLLSDLKKKEDELAWADDRYTGLDEKYRRLQHRRRQGDEAIMKLDSECAELRKGNRAIAGALDRIRSGEDDIPGMRGTIEKLSRRLEEEKSLNRAYKNENRTLRSRLGEMERRHAALNEETDELFGALQRQAEQCEQCANVDLCSKKVLLVGGLTGRITFYRNLVEKLGGRFDHHDGCCGNGAKILDSRILQSDVVICPVDVNSHAACLEVKRRCKKERKDFYMLRKSSISSVYSALVTVAENS
jgi:hypothetical protein